MKKIILSIVISFSNFLLSAQSSWAWLQGDAYTPGYGIYGTKGVAETGNKPGTRTGEASWKDASGNIWILGGNGFSISGSGYLSDLWKYTPSTGLWTWMNGDPLENQFGFYGTRGVSSPVNKVRARAYATTWVDASGNFWLFGGKGSDDAVQTTLAIIFNDFWKFSPSTGVWTWMGGDTAYKSVLDYAGVYGTKGTAATSNKPGSRLSGAGWTEASGDLWLFGGEGRGNSYRGALQDLWKYAPSSGMWTWIGGDNTENQSPIYGTKGVPAAANKPGSKIGASTWKDAAGNFLLFGGRAATTFTPARFSNDLWMYNPSTGLWTWLSGDPTENQPGIYGTKGSPSSANKPGARYGAASGIDAAGNLLMYGGSKDNSGSFNDLWIYNPLANLWTWVSGDAGATSRSPVYGQKGVPSDSIRPAAGSVFTSWTDNTNTFWISSANHIFRYSFTTNQWTWVTGDTIVSKVYPAIYGTKGVPASTNTPGSRQYGNSWTDASGNFWLFGGYNMYTSSSGAIYLNDLWEYTAINNQWTWMGGDSSATPSSSFGIKGIEASTNKPPGRQHAISWTDNTGNFWLFGGTNYFNSLQTSNDLWRYSPVTRQWTWMSGDSVGNSTTGVYETKGVAASTNKPGARSAATGWTDNIGNLWFYGGNGPSGYYNDLWKYSPVTGLWTWVSGDNTIHLPDYASTYLPVYGQKGVATSDNKPGGRYGSQSWTDASGDFWLFGGTAAYFHVTKSLNDLWKYSPLTGFWTWISGDNTYGQPGIYGTPGIAAANNKPGARNGAFSWKDASGNLFLFGGNVDTSVSGGGTIYTVKCFNDLWKYSTSSGLWTWLSGDNTINQSGTYGTPGIAGSLNKPGGRNGTAGWSDGSGNLWIYGGYGYPVSGVRFLNDMLKYTLYSVLPIQFSSFTVKGENTSVLLNWSTAQEQNSRVFIIDRSYNGVAFTSIGTVVAKGTSSFTTNYSFTDIAPIQGDNYYRLKEMDLDGTIFYSQVKKVVLREETARFDVINNPVVHDVQIGLQLPAAQKLILVIRDVNGQLLLKKEYMAVKGYTTLTLPVQHMAKGTYIISVHSETLHNSKTFLKQ